MTVPTLIGEIRDHLASGQSSRLFEALELAEQLPAPSGDVEDEIAQTLFDVAFHAESLMGYARCVTLYRRVLGHSTGNRNIHAGAWFRIGRCLECLSDFKSAADAYRVAIATATDWNHMTGLARWHLAELEIAAEEYAAARELLDEIAAEISRPDIPMRDVQLRRSRCLMGEGRHSEATGALTALIAEDSGDDAALRALQYLAQLSESAGNHVAAARYYDELLSHPRTPDAWRVVAGQKLKNLR
jgi:tetratricopeptide (TPR) repeat protein